MPDLAVPLYVLLGLSSSVTAIAAGDGADADTRPFVCDACAGWNAPVEPFLLAPDTWYVGSAGLSAVLIDSGDGLVLLDGGLPQSAAPIATRIRRLGFDLADIKLIVNSHAHFDHAGGIAALARWSGARVVGSTRGVEALRSGQVPADDPQAGYAPQNGFPPVPQATAVGDGETLQIGRLRLTAHYTPGHAPGSTSWHWPACDARGDCIDLVYADSLSAVSSPDFRFIDHPQQLDALRASIAKVERLRCDLVISTHPEAVDLFGRRQRGELVAADGCRRYAQGALRGVEARLQRERSAGR